MAVAHRQLNWPALMLATVSFAVSFAAWGLIGALAPVFTDLYRLSASQTALLVAVPVLLGSLARLPMGMLTDRYGGRAMFTVLLAVSGIAAFVVPTTTNYESLLASAFFIGLAGSSFAIGAAFVSRWTPPALQGTALGIFGLGLLGQSAAVFGGAVAAAAFGWPAVFRGMGALLLAWAVVFALFARNNPVAARPANVAAMLRVLRQEPVAWWLGAFYFLTFGGFVAFSIYLPTLLRAQFGLVPADAGFRAAGFVVLATLMRPLGGWLADRIGGAQVLSWVFGGVAGFSLLLMWPSMVPFTVGALGCAALLGTRQRRGVQAGPGTFPARHRHGHRTGWRARRPGRVLPAAAARRVQGHARRAVAGLRAAVADGALPARREPTRVPSGRRGMARFAAGTGSRRPLIACAPEPGPAA